MTSSDLLAAANEDPARPQTGPAPWAVYSVAPHRVEFWQADPGGLHDRLRYTRAGDHWETITVAQ